MHKLFHLMSNSVILIVIISLISSACAPYNREADEKVLELDRDCVQFYENIVAQYHNDTILDYSIQDEAFIDTDENHKLLKLFSEQSDSLCKYRGLRDYEEVVVVEIKSWCTNKHRPTKIRNFERHFLLVGDWKNFDVNQILLGKDERIIHEEIIGNDSKLFVTHR